jgi:HTH-type transcriptional regulator/antitoxin HigA
MNARVPAEAFPPGEFLKEELEARGWTQQELAEIMDRPPRLISEIIAGKRSITPETARGLGDAFGTGGEYWMNLETQYALSQVNPGSDAVQRRAALHARFPVREMLKRDWLQQSADVGQFESQVFRHFDIEAANDEPQFLHAAKKTSYDEGVTMLQLAWLFRTKQLASTQVTAVPYSEKKLREALPRLKAMLTAPEEARHVARVLGECGVRLVFVEALPGGKVDGACYWLDSDKPVIAMSLRFDRIDNFWFVLRHEIEHVLRRDATEAGYILDQDIEGDDEDQLPAHERIANEAAAEFIVPRSELNDFYARVMPYFSELKVCGFAHRIGVHPGLVVGQLQRRLRRHDFLRKHQVKVRTYVLAGADADGWDVLTPKVGS